MLSPSFRTLVVVLATLGLVATLAAGPALAQSEAPECLPTLDSLTTEEVTDGVTLTYDSDFVCTDAADAGTWSITVSVWNESETDVALEGLTLSHSTPPFGDEEASTAEAPGLPLTIPAGSSDSFEASGEYALVETGESSLVNLHLNVRGSTTDEEGAPFRLSSNVHVLGPGTELDEGEDGAHDDDAGRPSWAPGPPPWVIGILMAIFPDGFPWGSDAFPPGGDSGEADGANDVESNAGPPAWLELPPPATGDGDEAGHGEAPPAFVSPGEPPTWAPDSEDHGPPEFVPAAPSGGRPSR